jgi:hypothetical protein
MNAAKVIFFCGKYRCLPLFLVKLQCGVLLCMVYCLRRVMLDWSIGLANHCVTSDKLQ